jgi:hypothetical protein
VTRRQVTHVKRKNNSVDSPSSCRSLRVHESAPSPLVVFGELNDNTIKGLTSLLSVEQEFEFIVYTCGLWNEKCI